MYRIAAALMLLTPVLSVANSDRADLILLNGQILTVDEHDTVAEAIAIRRGVIIKTGSDAEIQALADPNARVIDLKGKTATPGLIDTHAHIAGGGVDELYGVQLSDAESVAEIGKRIKAKVSLAKHGEWITGGGVGRR